LSNVLAIETSCDETAACLLEGFGNVLGDSVFSQIAEHQATGGVVPEVASRSHLKAIPAVIDECLARAGCEISDVDAVAATTGPGLAPALLVGANAGRGLAAGIPAPFVPVNHLEGHLLSPFFGQPSIPPHTALVVSGGHTLLFDVQGFRHYRLLGQTRDDAAGEAYDKVAKMLGLGYPGGVEIDQLARKGDTGRHSFPRGLDKQGLDFSFSGLKTAVRIFLQKANPGEWKIEDVCAGFQESVAGVLVDKLITAAAQCNHSVVSLSGGVSSNSRLRELCSEACQDRGLQLQIADSELRTDNARMIAFVAALDIDSPLASSSSQEIQPGFQPDAFPFR